MHEDECTLARLSAKHEVRANAGTDDSRLWVWGQESDVRAFEEEICRMNEEIDDTEKCNAHLEKVRQFREQSEKILQKESGRQGFW